MPAFRAAVLRARICHALKVSGGCDNTQAATARSDRLKPAQTGWGPSPAETGTSTLACPAFSKLNVKL